MKYFSLVFLFLLFMAIVANATERQEVCAKYETEDGWSKGYKVEATILEGSELNQATHSFRYSSFSTYVVIFWGEGEASVIKMRWPFPSTFEQSGTDQLGKEWKINTSTLFCF